jgi:hypothetical protein
VFGNVARRAAIVAILNFAFMGVIDLCRVLV